MKRFDIKHITLAVALAVACVPAYFAQVNINAPQGLNRGTQPTSEPKTETPSQQAAPETAGDNTSASEGSTQNVNTGASAVNRPRTANNAATNNNAVNAANQTNKPWDEKQPVFESEDFSTGKNSTNLQSRQEVEMRSYGYRILVYHTNKSKNAKANAQRRAKDIAIKFPQYQLYFNYKAPTWRLRLGDFAQEDDARKAMKQLRVAFPLYAKEMTIIHDHINVWR